SAEGNNVGLDPPERELLIHDAIIHRGMPFCIEGRMCKEAQGSEPVVERDDDDTAALDKRCWIVELARSGSVASTVDPDHDGQLALPDAPRARRSGSVDVQKQAGLARSVIQARTLRTALAKPRRIQDTGRWDRRTRRTPTQIAGWWRGI